MTKLLIITQVLDREDDVLGFFHTWVEAFARECESVTVIALRVGVHSLPQNVKVLSLGKENGVSRIKYLTRFYRYITRERKNYDAVFVHMNQIYVILGGLLWKLFGKQVGLWYAHGHVPFSLRIATILADDIFTSTASGFRITTKKKHIVGQGIDTERFAFFKRERQDDAPFRAIVVGRISPVKDYETTIRALAHVKEQGLSAVLDIVGGAGLPEQEAYLASLKELANKLGLTDDIVFHGALPNSKIKALLDSADVFINTSNTGSFDKAVGEAMASGMPILTSNVAFQDVLGEFAPQLMFPAGNDQSLAKLTVDMIQKTTSEREELGKELSRIINESHSLKGFVRKLLAFYK